VKRMFGRRILVGCIVVDVDFLWRWLCSGGAYKYLNEQPFGLREVASRSMNGHNGIDCQFYEHDNGLPRPSVRIFHQLLHMPQS
jgi:hypothetical protein